MFDLKHKLVPSDGERPLTEIMAGVERSLLEQVMNPHKTTRYAAIVLKINQSAVVRKPWLYGIKGARNSLNQNLKIPRSHWNVDVLPLIQPAYIKT